MSIAYLQKQGGQQCFREVAAGARARAPALGVELRVVDLGVDGGRAVEEVRAAVAAKPAGMTLVIPNPTAGPEVAGIAATACVPLLASDDEIRTNLPGPRGCSRRRLLPRVGCSSSRTGEQVAGRAADEVRRAGWEEAGTRFLALRSPAVNVCRERADAPTSPFARSSAECALSA
ncbi:hypothetical protein ABZ667_40585 [Streptomyces lavendulae]|uniref:hypothetical protein n=1 Tax=Streptomyces lavendulae TaxID=1914 RepID=UPI0033C397E7